MRAINDVILFWTVLAFFNNSISAELFCFIVGQYFIEFSVDTEWICFVFGKQCAIEKIWTEVNILNWRRSRMKFQHVWDFTRPMIKCNDKKNASKIEQLNDKSLVIWFWCAESLSIFTLVFVLSCLRDFLAFVTCDRF